MKYDKGLITHKLERWEQYLDSYTLPDWKEIPDIGLYMDQVVALLTHYLDFIPAEAPSERPITPTTINNYVRLKVMPPPVKRKYYRIHLAYLIAIFTLKQSVSISCVQQVIPAELGEEAVHSFYDSYRKILGDVAHFFNRQTREGAKDILAPGSASQDDAAIERLIIQTMLMGGFSGILAQKLLYLKGADKEAVLQKEQAQAED